MLHKNAGRFNRQRTVHVNIKMIMAVDHLIFFYFADEIQQFLRTSDCKRWYDYISSPIKRLLDDPCQLRYIIWKFTMAAVTVSRLHHNIIRIFDILRITDQWLIQIADIPGKYNLFLHIVLFDPDLDGRRAKQMPCIHKPNADSICKVDFFVIIASNKTVDRSLCIVDIIQWHNFCPAGTLSFSVLPFRLKHLYVCTVSQHNITQIRSCSRRKNLSPKSPLVQKRKFTGMVDMSMRQKYHVNVTCRNRYLLIFKFIRSLLHSTVNQNMFSAGFQISTASSHLMRGSQKCNPHKNTFSLF